MLTNPRFKSAERANGRSRSVPEIPTDESPNPSEDGDLQHRKRRKRTKDLVPASRERGEIPTGMEATARAFAHPLRVKIIFAMNGPERERSASELEELLGVDVKRLSYHLRELAVLGFIEVAHEQPIRGTIEKIYAPVKRLEAWDEQWAQLPEAPKKLLASHTLGLAVEAIGASIGSGDFGKRNDSVLSQSTIWADERGAVELLAVLFQAAEALVRIEAEAKERLAEDDEGKFAISYLIAGYEGGVRPVT
jgi:DNA-binding HxlR family transcriptional regulator